jgi:ABC-type long-subunit fatty acid transport system fused permease/ATPase subunit
MVCKFSCNISLKILFKAIQLQGLFFFLNVQEFLKSALIYEWRRHEPAKELYTEYYENDRNMHGASLDKPEDSPISPI